MMDLCDHLFSCKPMAIDLQTKAGDIAHDLRNHLAVVKINTELALLDPTMSPELHSTIEDNLEEIDRALEIIRDL